MEFNFQHGNQNITLSVQKTSQGLHLAEVEGNKIFFDYRWISPDCLSLLVDNVSYKIFISRRDKNYEVFINGFYFTIEDTGGKSQVSRSADEIRTGSSENIIFAPMPGRILKILVKEKQKVKANQPLFILESMKMENEVQSHRAGRIGKIHHQNNDLVTLGDPIIEFID